MNYEDMSDFEINKKVGAILGLEVDEHKQDTYTTMSSQFGVSDSAIFFNDDDWHDYCDNPSDAWPIIVENKIGITHGSQMCSAVTVTNNELIQIPCTPSKILRAAMICFLKMKDAEK